MVLTRLLAVAVLTFMEMPKQKHALLALMAVSSLLKLPQLPLKLLIVHAQPTPTQPMESVPLVDAPLVEVMPLSLTLLRDPPPSLTVPALQTPTVAPRHALLALLALDLVQVPPTQPLPLLFACARQAFMVIPVPVLIALLAPMMEVEMPLKQLPALPLSLLLACAQSAPTELTPVLDVPLALWASLPPLLVRLSLLSAASALPTTSEMLTPLPVVLAAPHALPTLSPLLVPLLKLLAIARLTSTETPETPWRVAPDALLALMAARLLLNLAQLPLSLLSAHAPPTPMEPMPMPDVPTALTILPPLVELSTLTRLFAIAW
jgi:hypothetical protein